MPAFSRRICLIRFTSLAFGASLLLFAGIAQAARHPELPSSGTYKIDPDHSFVYFSAWHHIVGVVRGRFDKTTGTIIVGRDPAECAVDISIDTATINTQNSERDEDLRGADFFDTKHYPAMTYRGRGIHHDMQGRWVMDGELTIRGITKTVPIVFSFKGAFPDTPAGKPERISFHATAETKRGDFGMVRDNLMELGTSPMKPDVAIEIDVEADEMVAKH
ncbi:YceI family protein [Acidicapsa dinghuensis]|uniref:YceI family protein n=1 Tax=Acidicapsa dinghuensis TaxID=2218256 RepID=A0ABW1EIB1_9BACT|nr:YceI family protein [Acidicapsa dinghuensis]